MKTLVHKNNLQSRSTYSLSAIHTAISEGENKLSSSMKFVFVSGLRCHLRYKRGADLSLVDVGFSFTVANGLVPLRIKKKKK